MSFGMPVLAARRRGGTPTPTPTPTAITPTYDPFQMPEGLTNGAVIVPVGTSGDWDDTGIREIGNVIHDPSDTGKEYKLAYSGYGVAYVETDPDIFVGFAYSSDGVTWTKYSSVSPAISREMEDPYLVKIDGTYYLYAEDRADVPFRNIRCYTSTDFSTWTDQGDVLDAGAGGTWESQDVSSPVVWKDADGWHMLYEGRNGPSAGSIGYATSDDGLVWVKDLDNPIWTPDDVSWAGTVVPDDIMVRNDGLLVLTFHASIGPNGIAVGRDVYSFVDLLGTSITGAGSDTIMRLAVTDQWLSVGSGGIRAYDATTAANPAPTISVAPVITSENGFVGVGDTATCDGGTHTGVVGILQWKRDGVAISGAIEDDYTFTEDDLGADITCTVTAITSGGETDSTSNTLGPIVTPAFTINNLVTDTGDNLVTDTGANLISSERTA